MSHPDDRTPRPSWVGAIPQAAGAAVLALALTALAGWVLGLERLTSGVAGWATMKPNTAIALAALGIALLAPRWARRVRATATALAAGLAAFALAEWTLDHNLKLNQLLFTDTASLAAGHPPGRMAVATALGILLSATSISLDAVAPTRAFASQAAAVAAVGLSWMAILGYAYELGPLTTVWMYGTVSAPTALAIAAAGFGALCLRPTGGLLAKVTASDGGASLLRQLGPAALVVPALTAFFGLRLQQRYELQPGFALAVGATLDAVVFAAMLYTTASATRSAEAARLRVEVRLREVSRLRLEAHESERRQLARELHDEVGQTLTALGFLIARSRHDHAAGDEAGELVAALTESVRGLALDLRPAMLDDLGLPATLRWLVDRWASHAGLPIDLQVTDRSRRYPPAIETAAYRIVQEALTNVARHARASAVSVTVRCDAEGVELRVVDDGAGFDAAAVDRRESLGLTGMEERASLVGGTCRVGSDSGRTTVRAYLPALEPS